MAKKAKSSLVNMLLSLTLIAVVAGAVLALVSGITKEPIEASHKAKKEEALKAVLPQFKDVEERTVEGLVCNYAYNEAHELVGVAVESVSEKGFGGNLGVMIGFMPDGTINGYQVLQTAETPGLGAKAGEWFQKDGKGCVIGMNPGSNNITVKKDGGEVDAISGSTITSRAFCDAVAVAYNAFQKGGIE